MSTPERPLTWVDGEPGDQLCVLDRGLAYGDGLFETCRIVDGRVPLWPWHIKRLQASAQALSIALDVTQLHVWLRDVFSELTGRNIGQGTLKILLTRGVGGRGYQYSRHLVPTVVLQVYPDSLSPFSDPLTPLRVRVCEMRLAANKVLAGHKHLNRLENVLARSEWQNSNIHEGLMLDNHGCVIEATAHNVFIWQSGQWYTPALSECGVAGVMRQLLMNELLPGIGYKVKVVPITLAEMYQADEVILCNSNRGIRPVGEIIDTSGEPRRFLKHDNAQALRALLGEFVQGKGSVK
ncbi:aminodeoxychorismate lyase [Gilvimarinus agarilyticus]|uniref:aminodeoxychorismate lyase n=1 Tax=Gilvimarinus agarilyticus TaxID=679259 RepID=UPI0009FD5BD4|nr:aminodeoxychorismate lyase [Gilvimarinus agarilyticus]